MDSRYFKTCYKPCVRHMCLVLLFCGMAALMTSCQAAYYKTMEEFGYHKRDILVDRVQDAGNTQQEAKAQFKSALEKFSSVLNFQGGNLKEKYEQLSLELSKSEEKAKAVHDRISSVESVAEALFTEWESELAQYSNKTLAHSSRKKLARTKKRYKKLIMAMKRAEEKIPPVITVFRDNVLYLKHNLNAQAISSMRSELASVESGVTSLIKDMEASIKESKLFIKAMIAK